MKKSELSNLKILLVEDNKINQLLISKQLTNWGLIVDIASDGRIAIKKALANQYDLILMDLLMPNLDGIGATQQLRQMGTPHLCEIPIIALTASHDDEHYMKAYDAGITDYLIKPIDDALLYHCLCSYMLTPLDV